MFSCKSISNCTMKIIDRVSTKKLQRFWSFQQLNLKVILLWSLVPLSILSISITIRYVHNESGLSIVFYSSSALLVAVAVSAYRFQLAECYLHCTVVIHGHNHVQLCRFCDFSTLILTFTSFPGIWCQTIWNCPQPHTLLSPFVTHIDHTPLLQLACLFR
jgi:hypothetical protein